MRLRSPGFVPSLLALLLVSSAAFAGVSKEMEAYYTQKYSNRAMFLKVPVRGDRQTVHVLESGSSLDQSNLGQPLRFKVGEQVRITDLSFRDSSIEFRVSSIDTARKGTVIFQFRDSLRHSFPNRDAFDSALEDSFTEGLSYQDIDSAKEDFVKDQFDVLLQQFAVTTGTSVDFVLEAITEKNPKYRQAKQQLNEVSDKLQSVEVELQEERNRNNKLREEVDRTAGDLASVNEANRALRGERDQIARQRVELEKKVQTLEDENQRFRRQVEDVAKKLDVQTDSSSKLGEQVKSLSHVIDSLKQERVELSGKVEGLSQRVTDLTKKNGQLVSDLERTERTNKTLESDLAALTSNRDSLEATYLSLKRNKENLERAKALEAAVRVERSSEAREDGTYQVSSLYLLNQKIAILEVQEPVYADQEYRVSFQVESPDRVEFTSEEREFYETLGEKFRVETSWDAASGKVQPVLRSGEAVQEVAPREEADWAWLFEGDLSEPETVTLGLRLIDVDNQVLEVASQEFQIQPSGLFAHLRGAISLLSLMLGLGLGIVVAVIAGLVRGRSHPRRTGSIGNRKFEAQKKL